MFAYNKFYLLLSIKNNIYLNIPKIFKNDIDIIKLAIQEKYIDFKNLSIELQDNKEIICCAIKNSYDFYECVLEFASERLQDDIEIVLLAIKKSNSLEFASERLKNNKEVVLLAIKNGNSFEFASEELKHNKEVVLEAVGINGEALEFASEELKDNEEVVLKAVKNNNVIEGLPGYYDYNQHLAYTFASDRLQNNRQIILEAVKNNYYVYECIPYNFKFDIEIISETKNNKKNSNGW
jgi:hypothetical protein